MDTACGEPPAEGAVLASMQLLQKALFLSAAGLIGLYALARAVVPPTVYVLVAVSDATGQAIEFVDGWGWPLYMDDGALRPGMSVQGTDDLGSERRHRDIGRWSTRSLDGTEYAMFACRPDSEAAFAAMTDLGGRTTMLPIGWRAGCRSRGWR